MFSWLQLPATFVRDVKKANPSPSRPCQWHSRAQPRMARARVTTPRVLHGGGMRSYGSCITSDYSMANMPHIYIILVTHGATHERHCLWAHEGHYLPSANFLPPAGVAFQGPWPVPAFQVFFEFTAVGFFLPMAATAQLPQIAKAPSHLPPLAERHNQVAWSSERPIPIV